ncbi:MAG: alpha/beta fold hydrolase [Bacteroidetes bacterium]|nr:alpha/beta fold hydrolase [Bacteroidota bacterium]
MEKSAGDQFTFIAIDLPFHGDTDWKGGLNFTIDQLVEIVKGILAQENVNPSRPVTLIGYSLGGRVVLSLFQSGKLNTDRMVLLAPDGLKVNRWYWLATQTWLGNRFFAFTMKHPGWFFGMLKVMNRLGLVNASIFKFVNYYIGDETVRQLLYTRWTTLRKLKPRLSVIKKMIAEKNIPVRLVYGRHDRIILAAVGERFRKGIEAQCRISIIHAGHQVLHEKHAGEIVPVLAD